MPDALDIRSANYVLIKEFRVDGPEEASHLLVLAHGAGAGMATPFMNFIAGGVAAAGIRVVRFHFPYMEESVRTGRKKPPDSSDILRACYSEIIEHCVERERCPRDRLVIGGKSMGGRMATLIADEHSVAGIVCLGYPFHAPRQPQRLRTGHLVNLRTPTLICQGERDPFGPKDEVAGFPLSPGIRIHWIADGDHDLRPRKSSGRSEEQNLQEVVEAVREFIHNL